MTQQSDLEQQLADAQAKLSAMEADALERMPYTQQVEVLKRKLREQETEREKRRIASEAHALCTAAGIPLHDPRLAPALALGVNQIGLDTLRAIINSIRQSAPPAPPTPEQPAQPQQPADGRAALVAQFRQRYNGLKGKGNDTPAYKTFINDMLANGLRWDEVIA